jgi:hypothetical protein
MRCVNMRRSFVIVSFVNGRGGRPRRLARAIGKASRSAMVRLHAESKIMQSELEDRKKVMYA